MPIRKTHVEFANYHGMQSNKNKECEKSTMTSTNVYECTSWSTFLVKAELEILLQSITAIILSGEIIVPAGSSQNMTENKLLSK